MMKNLLIGLAIIHKDGKVLIGARKEKDEFVEHLSWVFPGGRIESLDLESEIKKIAKEETGLDVSVNGIAPARKIPEAKIDIVAVCTKNLWFFGMPKNFQFFVHILAAKRRGRKKPAAI